MPLIELRENQEEVQIITDDASKVLERQFNFTLEDQTNAIPTIAYGFLVGAIQYLSSKKKEGETVGVNLFDIMYLGINHDNVEAEKEGNYVPVVEAGEAAKKYVENASERPTDIFTYKEDDEEIKQITDIALNVLKSRFDITFGNEAVIIPMITYSFMATAVGYLFTNRCENGVVEINLFQLFDMGFAHDKDENTYSLFFVPGQDMKLRVKDDGVTEVSE